MAGVEWGPKSLPLENRRLLDVTQFRGNLLQDINDKTSSYLKEHPSATRDEAVTQLDMNMKPARIQSALDVLNQLSTIGRSGEDIRFVTVRQDLNKGSYWYEIDWINEPVEKPASPPQAAPQMRPTPPPIYPFKTAAQRAAEREEEKQVSRLKERMIRESIKNREDAEKRRIEVINRVIINTVREDTDQLIEDRKLKIDLGKDGVAVISYRKYLFEQYSVVDREKGTYQYGFRSLEEQIDPKYFHYFSILAQQAEGKKVEYVPDPYPPMICQYAYYHALELGLLRIVQNPNKGTIFQYVRHNFFTLYNFIYGTYGDMDLERNIVTTSIPTNPNATRPINPEFAEFLKQKKIELDT